MNSSASIRPPSREEGSCGLAVASLAVISVTGCTPDPEPQRRITAAQPFDASALTSALQRIVAWHQSNDTTTANALRPGLRETELQQQLKKLPCQLPLEIQALYGWRDGMQPVDAEWVWYHYFPSLEDGIQRYRQLVATGLLHPDEFPVLEFEGEYYVVRCASGVSARSPVWHVHQNPERVANYLSFTTYMETAAEWYESGAVTAKDLRAMRAIHQHRNPGAAFPYAVD